MHKLDPTVFERAADEIENRGLAKGQYVDADTGAVCLVGGLKMALGGRIVTEPYFYLDGVPDMDSPCKDYIRFMRNTVLGGGEAPASPATYSVIEWSDMQTDAAVVAQKLRDAAQMLRDDNASYRAF